jgi:hypothetical protein
MHTPTSSFCAIEQYSLGTLANGGVVLSLLCLAPGKFAR